MSENQNSITMRIIFRQAQQKEMATIERLRHEVFCVEKQWIKPSQPLTGRESDAYDAHSAHFVAYDTESSRIVGYCRTIKANMITGLPVGKHPTAKLDGIPMDGAIEISRLLTLPEYRSFDIILGLISELMHYCLAHRYMRWFIVVDTVFYAMLKKTGFNFEPVGALGQYMGKTMPATLELKQGLQFLKQYCRPCYSWFMQEERIITSNGLTKNFRKHQNVRVPSSSDQSIYSRNWAYIPRIIQDQMWHTRLLFAGTGLGSVFAELAVRTGFGHITIADGDTVATSNLNRQAYVQDDVHVNKAEALEQRLRSINPEVTVQTIPHYLDQTNISNLVEECDFVVNTIDFDNPAFVLCSQVARAKGKTCLFPLNIGWGGALFVFNNRSASLEETFRISPEAPLDTIKQQILHTVIDGEIPDYLLPVATIMHEQRLFGWPYDPQLGAGAYLAASILINTMVNLLKNEPVVLAPRPIHMDLNSLTVNKEKQQMQEKPLAQTRF